MAADMKPFSAGLSAVAVSASVCWRTVQENSVWRAHLTLMLALAVRRTWWQRSSIRALNPENHEPRAHLTLMLAFASAENMVAETPLRLAICCPTAARMQQSATCSTWWMRPDRSASANLQHYVKPLVMGQISYSARRH
jgi:hypothetical protein